MTVQGDRCRASVAEIDANHLTINTHPDTVKAIHKFLANPSAR